jgi:hypothetical protein
MGTDPPNRSTELADFLAVLTQSGDDGCPFIVVGGQAANYWANLYLEREPRLRAQLPFTSKDLDVIGSRESAVRVARTLGWQFSPPVVGGGPVQGVVSSGVLPKPLTVEFLSEIKGVPPDVIRDFARENTIRSEDSDRLVPVRVLDPAMLLYGKVRNAVDIGQDAPEKPRQDVKHVAMLSLCVPHFLADVHGQVAGEAERKESLGKYVTLLVALKHSYSGRQFEARHPGVIQWRELVPEAIRRLPWETGVRASLRQLTGEQRSRGIRI